ncbi:hypothetical protein [Massilibacterium senegalense]|uniref:hypothetical protein n=1 Tax=Massilibacterium senegalense TaxID=1632858 RepID=UPI0007802DB0|nr:hypothetical protein [Massilibacterium senegalense]
MHRMKIGIHSIFFLFIFILILIISLPVNTWGTSIIRAFLSGIGAISITILFDYLFSKSVKKQKEEQVIAEAEESKEFADKEQIEQEESKPPFEEISIEQLPKIMDEKVEQSSKVIRTLLNEEEE